MSNTASKPLTGRKVLMIFVACFGVIITVNLTLAFNAVATFPGLETRNSYVASQHFDANRKAQEALNWDVAATVTDGTLRLSFDKDGAPIAPVIRSAVLGRATNVAEDQTPELSHDGTAFTAPVALAKGNWNLRVEAQAADGTIFKQRVIVKVIR